jgi:formylglycine-generating enzyme required for sulfatase activity
MTRILRWIALLAAAPALGAVDFMKDVKPILESNCLRCHRPMDKAVIERKTQVALDTRENAFRVPSTIVPGKPEESKLFTTTIAADDAKDLMPPRNPATGALTRLPKPETEILKQWIAEGAHWPEGQYLIAQKSNLIRYPDDTPELIGNLHARILAAAKEKQESEMNAYSTLITNSDVKFDMVPIPGGKFQMGSRDSEKGRKPDEGPVHEVELEAFWMGKCEVTWDEYLLFMSHAEEMVLRRTKAHSLSAAEMAANKDADAIAHPTNPFHDMSFGMSFDGRPAISMTQHAANKYCQWLSAKTGHFYRLPTEAEWEYAARAGTTTTYFWGDDPARISEYCWWFPNSDAKYRKVGLKKPNPWGLHDILGNVAEWTLDQYGADFYGRCSGKDPWNKATRPYPHSVRGGSWDDDNPAALRCAVRRASHPSWKEADPQSPKSIWYHTAGMFLGFRIVRPLKVPGQDQMEAYWNNGVHRDDPNVWKAGE